MITMQLTRGYSTTVDDEDFEELSKHKWSALVNKKRNGLIKVYAVRGIILDGKKIMILMHRQLLGIPHGSKAMIDHADLDSLNNQRLNLRLATYSQNNANMAKRRRKGATSKFKGVGMLPNGKWRAMIRDLDSSRHLGVYATEELAAKCYDDAARAKFGEFARLNYMEDKLAPEL